MRARSFCVYLGWLIALIGAACTPAPTPPILLQTPGEPVTITDEQVITAAFIVDYPAGWRVITAEARAPLRIILAAPENCALIIIALVQEAPPTPPGCETAALRSTETVVERDEQMLYAAGVSTEAAWEWFMPIYETVIASLR